MQAEGGGHVSKKMMWAGWVVSALPTLMLLMAAGMSLLKRPEAIEGLVKYGYPEGIGFGLGVVLLVCVIVYLIPQTAVLGAILLTGYLGGAVATHVRAGEPFVTAVVVGVLVWLGLYLRDAGVRALVPLRK